MDSDVPYPSIEYDELPDVLPAAGSTKAQTPARNTTDRMSLGTATSTPLPSSSPLKSPRKTPRLQRQSSSIGSPASETPSYQTARSSPANNNWRSATPTLNMKRSNSNLAAQSGIDVTPSRQSGARRISSNQIKTISPSPTIKAQEPEKKPVTAGSVAREYFSKELAHTSGISQECQTVVIVHDSCYGHRFSRPRTSRAALSTIVERPERILATILGVSAAYVRLGDRHDEGRHGPHPQQDPAAISKPPFTIRKTSRFVPLKDPAVIQVHGAKWMEELQIMCDSAEGKLALNGKELVRPIGYGKDENGASLPKLHEGDLYLCAETLAALQGCLGGVCDAVDAVFSSDKITRAFVCIRPPGHHCSSNFPSGFCWLNNVHVGIAQAAITHGLTHAAIIDFDLHHGDGSQTITWDHNRRAQTLQKNTAPHKKTPIGYFSLHDINSYPCEMGDEDKVRNASLCIENAHGQSIWNVHLEPWRNLEEFWKLYETRYIMLLEKTRVFLQYHTTRLNSMPNGPGAKAAIFLSAGFDASEWEGAGMQRHKVNVPTEFYARFTADVVRLAEEEGLGVDGRVISVLEGGYSDRALTSGVLSHVCGLAQSKSLKAAVDTTSHSAKIESLNPEYYLNGFGVATHGPVYDPEWWAAHNLELLESRVNPDMRMPTKKAKDKHPSDYSAPTEASTAKMTETALVRRSLSAQFGLRLNLEPEPVQPPPEVDWATAAYELSRLIIPDDRQTTSCRHEDLNAEATRARKERQSLMPLSIAEEPRELRARKAKPAPFEPALARVRSKSREAKRRTTVASVADLPDPEMRQDDNEAAEGTARPRRRSSAASSMMSAFEGLRMNDGRSAQPSQTGSDPSNSRASSVVAAKISKAAPVKKPRAVPKAANKPRLSPKKAAPTAPPVPRVPSLFTKPSDSDMATTEIITDEQRSSQASSGNGGSVVRADEMNALAGSINKLKIKLKLPSPEENAERERKAAAAQTKPKAIKKPPIPKLTKAAKVPKAPRVTALNRAKTPTERSQQIEAREGSFYDAEAHAHRKTPAEPTVPTGEILVRDQPTHTTDTMEPISQTTTTSWAPELVVVPPATVSPTTKPFDTVEDPPTVSSHTATAVVDTPQSADLEHASAVPAISPQDSVKDNVSIAEQSEENNPSAIPSTPSAAVKRTKADLPTFTSSSPIPFSMFSGNEGSIDQARKENHAKYGQLIIDPGEDHVVKKAEPSIWDIPETPLPQR
jgi:histone deacetylase HOS3